MDPQVIQSHFAAAAPGYDRWRQRNPFYHQDLIKLCRFYIPPGLRVLEIGAATGHLLAALEPSLGVGIDWAEPMVTLAGKHYPQYHFYCLDATTCSPLDLPADQRQFDVIVLADVLGYITDIQQLLSNLQAFCQDHTRLLFTFHNFLWEPLLHLAERIGQRRPQPPQNWLSMQDTLNLLQITGYIPVHRGQRFLAPKRIPILSEILNRWIAPLPLINHLCLTQYILARKTPTPRDPASLSCSIVVPARNEAGNIAPLVARCPMLGCRTELIFVEGHSRDRTWETIQAIKNKTPQSERFQILTMQQKGIGKGDAVRLGFAEATGDVLMILDADLTVQPEDLVHFWDVIVSGRGEFINGSRLVYPHSQVAMPFINRLANKFFA
ncbi:MAG: glycosyltransferase, partial [Thermostichales cyanobacterium SRBZ-1_bins_19]